MAEELPPTASPSPKSTRSARSATVKLILSFWSPDISIHALRKERDRQVADAVLGGDISIHALRKERDRQVADAVLGGDISIHALRKERDNG